MTETPEIPHDRQVIGKHAAETLLKLLDDYPGLMPIQNVRHAMVDCLVALITGLTMKEPKP